MRNVLSSILLFVLFISLFSCATHPPSVPVESATPSGPRTILIDGDTISEKDVEEFTCWYCRDYINGGPTLVKVGYFNFSDSVLSMFSELLELPEFSELLDSSELPESAGFVLYDGGNSGDFAMYRRTGLEHRWDWGPDNNYSFTIKPDGTGLYYDFTTVPERESANAREIYKCYKR